jgi:hypothetical protein
MTVVTFLSSVQLLVLGVIGEYLGRMYEQVKGRPLFIIDQVIRSDRVEDREESPGSPESREGIPQSAHGGRDQVAAPIRDTVVSKPSGAGVPAMT